ncbi:L-amino acid N-acyltransferase YncA [Roseateles sp. YR242]|uniref:GNAT family N-acetyltransferase n=1 Tax=Roseateles sp. YR242 TaxID=1855305 RepID=UPI0008C21AA8|nr:GNAT family N-acetyltransferase [Roseateles sp. YR242]SEK24510.1 L-amino acid N-acyltransferase YncA [Roseateles sp. YR242]
MAAALFTVDTPYRPPPPHLVAPPSVLRPAVAADATAIAAIYNASLRGQPYQPDGVTPEQGARWLADVLAQVKGMDAPPVANYLGPMSVPMATRLIAVHGVYGRPMLVATIQGETVGWMGSIGLHERPGLSPLYEFSYYVAPRWRGHGIGTQLVRHLIAHAPGWRVDRLLATVWSDNAPSLAVLSRLDFQYWGTLPGAILAFGKRRDLLLLGMTLPDANTPSMAAAPAG